jgi:hypothetical protein
MLLPLADGYQALGRSEEARQASLHAVTLDADPSRNAHLLWLAVEEAIGGETGTAESRLAEVPESAGERRNRFLFKLARAVIAAHSDTALARTEKSRDLRVKLAAAGAEMPEYRKQLPLRRIYRRSVRFIARRLGGLRGLAWYLRSI